MMKIHLILIWEFMQTGLFAIGGGYAAIPFLFSIQQKYGWFTLDELADIIAVSNITPGPVGINAASYAGYKTAGLPGAFEASIAIVFIPFIFTITILKLFSKFQHNKNVIYIFSGLKAAACALLIYTAAKLLIQIFNININNPADLNEIDYVSAITFFILLLPFSFIKKNPVLTIVSGAFLGIIISALPFK